jgi:murein DD-endopeptidase MepM/ murein hydrolase activator NlpD
MLENAKIAKDMGFAAAGAAVTVDPELKKAILEQEENKKLVEQLKESSDPASIFLGQYGKMLQQGFNPEQAKEVLSVLAQASGQMGGLTRVSSQINGITTPEQATAAIGESFTSNIGSLFGDNSTIWDTELANAEGRFGELIKAGLTSSDLSEGFKIIEDGIAAAYKEGASKGLSDKDISDTLNKSFSTQLEGMGFKEGDEVYDTINNLGDSLEDTRLKAALVQATAAQIDLSKFIEDLDVSKAKAEELYLVLASTDALASTNTRAIADAQRVIDEIDKEIQVRTAYFDQLAVNNENAQASEEERTKNFQKNIEKRNKAIQKEIKGIQKAADEQIKTKEKEIDAIEESSDKYLKALQSQKDESSFLASQQQTALGGLGALASGDVIGFLQARDEMASAAQSNAQEEEIKKIEDLTDARVTDIEKTIDAIKEKADAEVGTLQDQLEKNQELMDKEGERHENRMAALQKEAIQIQTNKSAEIKAFDDSKAALQEFINTPVGDKLGKDLTKYAEAISNVAANMPAHSKNIMNDLATSFGNNFQSVFDAEVQKSAEEFGVDPTDLKTLVQKSLPKNGGSGVKASDRFAKGGYVSGPGTGTSDSISAQLSNGEYVVKADSVKRIGKDTLDRINAGTGGMITRTSTTEGYRVGGGEAITAAAAFAGGVKTAVSAITSANALVKAAASAMNEEPENSDGGGTGKTTSIPEQLGKVARILRGTYKVSARGTYPSGNPHSARYGTAIDYATPTGTGVYAMAGGTASNLNKGNSSFGKYVTIKHADGTESLYAHLDSHGQGGTVNAGDFIGETGNTGNSTGPHLHFEWSALKNGFNPPGMRIGGETMSDGLANLHKGELVLTKPLTQQLKDGIGELKFGMPSASGVSPIDSGTMVSSSNTYNISVDASGPSMDPNKIAQKIVTAISREEDRRSFGRTS